MTTTINPLQLRLEEIKKSLANLGSRESSFIKVELLFFDAISLSREIDQDLQENTLFHALKDLQQNQYEKTKEATRKPGQREVHIRRFIVQLKKVLSSKI
jgi:hypothetical protein